MDFWHGPETSWNKVICSHESALAGTEACMG
jgi:hypothetical protein